MKIIWKGSIAFGLVSIPIEIYSAIESHALGFTLLHEKCKTPLKYHRWCPHCEEDVSWDQTVKGLKKGEKYIILTQEKLHELRPQKTEMINIVEFVSQDQVDPIYFNNHYYVAPTKNVNAYALFIKALEKLNKAAIGRFVMRDKEYICILQPYNSYLLLTTLHYSYEIRGIDKLAFEKQVKLEPTELKLAQEFINKLSVKKFDITKFKDTFAQQLKLLLKKKPKKASKAKKPVKTLKKKKPSLEDSLKESLRHIDHRKTSRPAIHAKKK